MRRAGSLLGLVLLLLALPIGTQGQSCTQPPDPPQQAQPTHLMAVDLLELGAPAVRYLRAFTTQCWLPDQNAPIAMFDNSWAVALVTIWSDLTGPSNGLGRLVTAMQLQTEAALMIDNQRPSDALSVLELAVLFTLYPVHHDAATLASWHQSLASNHTLFAARRLSLARTLTLMTQAQAAVGSTNSNVDALEAAMIAGRAAGELLAMTDPAAVADAEAEICSQSDAPAPARPGKAPPGSLEDMERLLAEVARNTAKALRGAKLAELEGLLDKRGLKCRWKCGKRSALLKTLVPALRVPLRLVSVDGEEASSVDVPSDLHTQLLPTWLLPEGSGVVERLGGIFAQVVATLQQPLLSDVGIKCTNREGTQLLHRCHEQAARQFGSWSTGLPTPSRDMSALLAHVMQVEEALWRLDQVLEQAMTGVRLGDGTTWVKNRGYTWVLGQYMQDKLYPQGQGAPTYYQTRRPSEPHVGSTICLDKTYLLDTVLRLDVEGLRGLQYALDNLQYSQLHSGGADAFWKLLAQDNPICQGVDCATGKDPISQLVPTAAGADAPPLPRPEMVDFRFVSEQQLQANLAAATNPSYRPQDPFVAAFVSLCVVSCASLYLYSHRSRLVRALTPQQSRSAAAAAAVSVVAQRNVATTALREALSGDSVQKLLAAIDAAEGTGVEKPLVKKARAALQALKKRKQQQQQLAGGLGASGAAALHRQPPPQQQQQPRQGGTMAAAAAAPNVGGLVSTGSGLSSLLSLDSSTSSGSLTLVLSERTAALLAAASEGWLDMSSSCMEGLVEEDGEDSGSSAPPSPSSSASLPAALRSSGAAQEEGTPPKPTHLASCASDEYALPTSPGTPVESAPRSSPGDASASLLNSTGCTPLPSPCVGQGVAGSTPPLGSAGDEPGGSPRLLHAPSPLAPAPPTLGAHTSDIPSSTPSQAGRLHPLHASRPSSTASESGSASTPTAASTSALASGLTPLQCSTLTPRQQKKLLRLQQKHAAAAATAAAATATCDASPGVSAAPAGVVAPATAEELQLPPSPSQPAPPSPGAGSRASEMVVEEHEQGLLLSELQLKAKAAREESAPSRLPRSAKKKAKQANVPTPQLAPGSSSGSERPAAASRDGSRHGAGEQEREPRERFVVRRTLSAPSGEGRGSSLLSPLRQAGGSRAQADMFRLMQQQQQPQQDQRARHMAGYPSPSFWRQQGGPPGVGLDTQLNANAPEFSPTTLRGASPGGAGRLTSPGGYPLDGLLCPPGMRGPGRSGYGGTEHGLGGMPRTPGMPRMPYSPNSALNLAYVSSSGHSSLDPAQPVPPAGTLPPGSTPALQQHHGLLASLQQIWGEGPESGGAASMQQEQQLLPGFGFSGLGGLMGGGSDGSEQQQQQQQQMAALMFMQQLEMQQHSLALASSGQGGLCGSPGSAPVSPQQLPPASADMLRDVLGSPLSLLPRGSTPAGGQERGMRPGMRLSRELAAAQAQALRTLGEEPSMMHSMSPAGSPRRQPAAARHLGMSLHDASAGANAAHHHYPHNHNQPGGHESPMAAASLLPRDMTGGEDGGLQAHTFDSFDLEALGFTESGE